MQKFLVSACLLSGLFAVNSVFADATTPTAATTAASAATSTTTAAPVAASTSASAQQTAADDSAAVPADAAAAKQTAAATVSAKLALEQKNDRLYARIILSQTQSAAGKVQIAWTAPAHSGCDSSKYALNYRYKTFHTDAYRTLSRTGAKNAEHLCVGQWSARIMDTDNNVLASASFEVKNASTDAEASMQDDSTAAAANSSANSVTPAAAANTQSQAMQQLPTAAPTAAEDPAAQTADEEQTAQSAVSDPATQAADQSQPTPAAGAIDQDKSAQADQNPLEAALPGSKQDRSNAVTAQSAAAPGTAQAPQAAQNQGPARTAGEFGELM